jgi:hypothetical protein
LVSSLVKEELERLLLAMKHLAESISHAPSLQDVEWTEFSSADITGGATPLRTRSTLELANDVLENPGLWLKTPNPRLGDRQPIDLIETDEEFKVYNLLNAVDQGLF